jgi:hypothetical protein
MKNYYWDNPLFANLKGVLWVEDNPHGRNEVTRESSNAHFYHQKIIRNITKNG